jgi:Outer membrane protein beta-barrel domain
VPVLVKYAVTHGGSRSFFVFGGPSAAFKVRSRATATFGDTTIDLDADEDIESFEFGVVAGGGVDFGKWSIDGRYSWGLSNLNKDDEDDVKLRSRAFSVLAGIRF